MPEAEVPFLVLDGHLTTTVLHVRVLAVFNHLLHVEDPASDPVVFDKAAIELELLTQFDECHLVLGRPYGEISIPDESAHVTHVPILHV